jgi:hypothetical protein
MAEAERGYEFTAVENRRFTRLAGAMQIVALLQLAGAALAVVLAAPAALEAFEARRPLDTLLPIAGVGVPLFVAVWTWRAGGHLRLVVRTQGDDIRHLMAAIAKLTTLYILQIWLFLAALGFVAFSLVAHGAYHRLF